MGMTTGNYTGCTKLVKVNTGLTVIKSLTIIKMLPGGGTIEAWTGDTFQAGEGAGAYLNGGKKDLGITLAGMNFSINVGTPFNENGVTYYWEARCP
jgi:hypothetical protein